MDCIVISILFQFKRKYHHRANLYITAVPEITPCTPSLHSTISFESARLSYSVHNTSTADCKVNSLSEWGSGFCTSSASCCCSVFWSMRLLSVETSPDRQLQLKDGEQCDITLPERGNTRGKHEAVDFKNNVSGSVRMPWCEILQPEESFPLRWLDFIHFD